MMTFSVFGKFDTNYIQFRGIFTSESIHVFERLLNPTDPHFFLSFHVGYTTFDKFEQLLTEGN